jgi:glycosyltransferase involved in cell wall biosynthesis
LPDTERPRVLFCIPELARGGPDAVFFNLLRTLDQDRFEPFLAVTTPEGAYLRELGQQVPVLQVGHQRYPVRGVIRAVRAIRPDLVMATLRMNVTCAAASPGFGRPTPLICRIANNLSGEMEYQTHRSSDAKTRAIAVANRAMVARATTLIAQSDAMADDIEHLYGERAQAKTVVLPNPVDIDRVAARGSEPAAVTLETGTPQVVSAGRLTFQKGFDRLVDAFARIRQVHPAARLWILGEGEDRPALEVQIARLGLSEAVDLPGFVDNPVPYYRAADLYLCSSRYEGFPNSVAEALAVGTPIVVPRGAAGGEALVTPTNGRTVDEGTDDELAVAALEVLANLSGFSRRDIAAECGARFSLATVTARYEDVLARSVLRQQRN